MDNIKRNSIKKIKMLLKLHIHNINIPNVLYDITVHGPMILTVRGYTTTNTVMGGCL